MENETENIAGDIESFVLAGGASSRMGRNKAHLPFGDTTLVELAANAVGAVTNKPINIVGNCLADDFPPELKKRFCFLPDDLNLNQKSLRGAIIGLQTVFNNSKTAWAAITACDLPFVSGEFFWRLTSFRTDEFDAIVPVQPDGRWQPLAALYRSKTCLPPIEKLLAKNVWSVKELLQRVRTRSVKFVEINDLPDADRLFLNVNTPAEYETALIKAAARA